MHYYQFNIGDYFKHTRHLTLLEDLAYRRLLDFCYTNEKPIDKSPKQIARLIGMPENQAEVEQVLEDFFSKSETGYFQNRISEEIEKYRSKADSARANGKKGGRPKKAKANPEESGSKPKKTQSVNLANPEESGSKANQEPITNNQEPLLKEQGETSSSPKPVLEVFKFWCDVMGKSPGQTKLTAKREKAIKGRLKEGYSLDDIKTAITGCRNDPFSMGANDRQKAFNDIELICRTGEKLESFMQPMTGGMQSETGQRRDNSAAGRVRANVQRELAEIEQRQRESQDSAPVAIDGQLVRP